MQHCSGTDTGYSHGLLEGSPHLREGRVSEWTTPGQIGTTHYTPGPQ